MAAFVCVFQRDGRPVAPDLLERLAAPLERYGGADATTRRFLRGPVGLALRRPAGAVSEAGRGTPPLIDGPDGAFAVCGRFHPPREPASPDLASGEIDDGLLARSTGSFALAAVRFGVRDGTGRDAPVQVTLVRDHLGSWPLCYHLSPTLLLAASDPAALLRHPDISAELDEGAAARFLGFRFTAGGDTFFRRLPSLPPGHRLDVGADDQQVRRYWRFEAPSHPVRRDPEEAAETFRQALARAVADDLADLASSRVALSLSGGLDSAAVAVAARDVSVDAVHAFTWTLEKTPEADERRRATAVAEHLGLPLTEVAGDGLEPLSAGFVERYVTPASPHLNPFAALKGRLYDAARAAGCRRVLVGDGGDVLYAARSYWLRDLLAQRRPGALGDLASTLAAAAGNPAARLALARLTPAPAWHLARRLRPAPPWLTAEGRRLLPPQLASPVAPEGGLHHRYEMAAGAKNSELESEEQRLFALCGVERANPFWSWPLLTALLQLPAHLLYRPGRDETPGDKALGRLALRGRLPDAVVEAERSGLLGGFFLRGLERNRALVRREVFEQPRSDWRRYVRRERVEPHLDATSALGFGHTLLWRVIAYELWWRRLSGDPWP